MRRMILFLLLLVASLVAVVVHRRKSNMSVRLEPVAAGVIPANSLFHKPRGANCPAGTELRAKFFSEEDGSTQDACFNPKGDGSTDYLNPGEGMVLKFHIHLEDEPEPPTEKI